MRGTSRNLRSCISRVKLRVENGNGGGLLGEREGFIWGGRGAGLKSGGVGLSGVMGDKSGKSRINFV